MKIALIKVRNEACLQENSWINIPEGNLDEKFEKSFRYFDGIIFMGSMGILARKIGEHIKSKLNDPCVVLVDEKLKYCIPVLSSHLGGGIDLCLKMSSEFGCEPVFSTATDLNGLTGVDLFARRNNMVPDNKKGIQILSAKLLKNGSIRVKRFPGDMSLPKEYILSEKDADMGFENGGIHLNLVRKNLVLGIGFHTDANLDELVSEFENTVPEIFRKRILVLASHEKKWQSPVFHEFSRAFNIFHTVGYDSKTLGIVIEKLGIDCENMVKKHMGISHISMPSAYLASFQGREIMTVRGKTTKFSLYEIENDFWNRYQNCYETAPEAIL